MKILKILVVVVVAIVAAVIGGLLIGMGVAALFSQLLGVPVSLILAFLLSSGWGWVVVDTAEKRFVGWISG